MTVLEVADGYLIRFVTGEEIFSGLTAFAKRAGIGAAWVEALGALSRAELGFWDAEKREYLRLPVDEETELAALVGNVSLLEGAPFPHFHATLTRRDFTALGGHLFAGVTGPTVEMRVRVYPDTALVRARNEAAGLNLWSLPEAFAPES